MTESQRESGRKTLRPVWFLTLVFAAVLVVTFVSRWMTPAEVVPWKSDLAAAQSEARAANKPMLLYFTAEWCGPCQWMRRYVWSDRQVADALRGFVSVRIDIDKDPATAMRFHVKPIPVFFIVRPDGQIARTHEGAMEAQEFINWLSAGS